MKQKFLLSTLLATLLFSTTFIEAKTDNKILVQHQIEKDKDINKPAPKEIIDATKQSFMAMAFLENDNLDTAKKALVDATKKFDKALKDNPKLDIVPIFQDIEIFEFNAEPQEIVKMLDFAEELIKNRRTQDARDLLIPLKDEMDINTEFIPMGIYPIATKNALSAIEKGDKESAKAILAGAFNMLINQKVILPLSLLASQDLVIQASSLDKTKKDEAIKLLDEAKSELTKAELLGYTSKRAPEYKALSASIKNIEKEIKGKNIVEKLYDKLNADFSSLIQKIKLDTNKVSPEEKEKARLHLQTIETKEDIKAINTEPMFKKEAIKDENKTIK